jgi:hypothetical protein
MWAAMGTVEQIHDEKVIVVQNTIETEPWALLVRVDDRYGSEMMEENRP